MKNYLTTKDIMEMFQVTRLTVTNWRTEKNLPFFHLGSLVRFDPEEVAKWAEEHKTNKRG